MGARQLTQLFLLCSLLIGLRCQGQEGFPEPRELAGANSEESSWSPDGKRIAFDSARDSKYFNIYVLDVGTGTVTRLTKSEANDITPAWSPDGRRIAFTSQRDGNREVYVMNADGSAQTRLTNSPSADGQAFWFP